MIELAESEWELLQSKCSTLPLEGANILLFGVVNALDAMPDKLCVFKLSGMILQVDTSQEINR